VGCRGDNDGQSWPFWTPFLPGLGWETARAYSAVWSGSHRHPGLLKSWRSVTLCDRSVQLTFGFRLNPWDPQMAQPPGSQPGREVPDDHCCPIHCPRYHPAALHRSRTARPRRVPGRVPRADPRGLCAGPAPVHRHNADERAQATPASQSQPGAAVALAQRDGRGAVPFSASSRRWISISSSRYR
jgi:hypothetical protein